MAVTFHCDHCGKKIEASDSACGKWGKCPGCHNKVYVPGFNAGEELKLAPIDESEKEKQERLMSETYRLRQDILHERQVPDDSDETAVSVSPIREILGDSGKTTISASQMSDKELTKKIITYLRQIADGNLTGAENIAETIVLAGRRAIEILDRIALSEMPEPELADVPAQVLSGLIRQLRAKIS